MTPTPSRTFDEGETMPTTETITAECNVTSGTITVHTPDATDTDFAIIGGDIRTTSANIEPWGAEEYGMERADAELAAMGWRRTSAWTEDGGETWTAPVEPVPHLLARIKATAEAAKRHTEERDELVRAALRTDLRRADIAAAAGVKEARLYQIRDGRR